VLTTMQGFSLSHPASPFRIYFKIPMEILFLGTGTSHGVPMLDCMLGNYAHCPKGVCLAAATDKKHARTRSSIMVGYNGKHVLIDVSPDFREQTLREKVARIDAILLTHKHADHIMGIPDLRSYDRILGKPIDVYGSAETIDQIKITFDYVFDPATYVGGGIPRIKEHIISDRFSLFDMDITPIPVTHGSLKECFGYRIGNLGYVPDVKEISSESKAKLKGVEVLILNCLRDVRPHPTHLLLDQSIALAREIRPKQCYFIHLCHDIHYQLDKKMLDDWMEFSYDGLQISL
jgi:phosphoribosyl 1,2-cyclic phosphate phosphodiesterase